MSHLVFGGMAHLVLLEHIAARALRRERVFRERTDMFAESDEWLFSRFRLPREVLIDLCNSLEPHLSHITNRSHPIPPYLQVLCTIGLLATGTFQREIGDRAGSQPSISRAIHKVVKAIVGLTLTYVKFPYDVAHQMVVKRGFYEISGIPNTIGAIDCTHVRTQPAHDRPSTLKYGWNKVSCCFNVETTLIQRLMLNGWKPAGTWPIFNVEIWLK